MWKKFVMLFLVGAPLLLSGYETTPVFVDYSQVYPSCGGRHPHWKTGVQAFNGAPEMASFFSYLKKVYSIDAAVETGTCLGNTTACLSALFDTVFTIEIDEQRCQKTAHDLKELSNVYCLLGNSGKVLEDILPGLQARTVLFYLDAHWDSYWPLRDELEQISKTHKDNCVVVIDDCKVPGRKDIPFDKYGEHECSYEYVKNQLAKVFTEYEVFYIIPKHNNSRAKLVVVPKR